MARLLCSLAEIGRYGKDLALADETGTRYLMLFRDGERVVGFHNVCPHQARGLNLAPDRFHFTREGWLMCAHHGASFDLATGRCVEGPCRGAALKPLELEIRDGRVWLAGELA